MSDDLHILGGESGADLHIGYTGEPPAVSISASGPLGTPGVVGKVATTGAYLRGASPLGSPRIVSVPLGLRQAFVTVTGPLGKPWITASEESLRLVTLSAKSPLGTPRALVDPQSTRTINVSAVSPLGTPGVLLDVKGDRLASLSLPTPLGDVQVLVNTREVRDASLSLPTPLGDVGIWADTKGTRQAQLLLSSPLGTPSVYLELMGLPAAHLSIPGPLGLPRIKASAAITGWISSPGPLGDLSLSATSVRLAQAEVPTPLGTPEVYTEVVVPPPEVLISAPGPLGRSLWAFVFVGEGTAPPIEPPPVLPPIYPDDPSYPGDPIYPGDPDYPRGPVYLGDPDYPADPINPGEPIYPGDPDYPGLPAYPGDPDYPGDPIYPGQPGYPQDPQPERPFGANAGLGFVLIPPMTLAETDIISTTASVDELDLWDSTKCYKKGEQVRLADGTQWEAAHDRIRATLNNCKAIYNVNRLPATAKIPLGRCKYEYQNYYWWKEIEAPDNPYRMFDPWLETQTTATDELVVEVLPPEPFNALAIFGITAASVRVELSDPIYGTQYDRFFDLAIENPKFPSVRYKDTLTELDFPEYDPASGAILKLTFTGVGVNLVTAVGMIKVSFVCLGMRQSIGLACYETKVGIRDYSQKDRDVWGLPMLREDTYADRVSYRFEAETSTLNALKSLIAQYRATPCAYIGVDFREETHVFGWYEDFSIPVESVSQCIGTLDVLGLPFAYDRPYDIICRDDTLLGSGKTIFACGGLGDPGDCLDEAPIAEGEFGACQELTVETVCGNLPAPLTGMASDDAGNLVEVGLSGHLFYNGRRTALSPWYSMNFRDISWGYGVFVAVGDDGLIARSTDGENWSRIEGPYPGVNYTKVVISPAHVGSVKEMVVAFAGCARAFSWDLGETFEALEDLGRIADSNVFNGSRGISYVNRDRVFIDRMSCFSYNENRFAMAGGRTIHTLTGSSSLWQTRTEYATFGEGESIIDCAISTQNSVKFVFISGERIVRCTDDIGNYIELLNPFSSDLLSVQYVDGEFWISSVGGEVARIGSQFVSLSVKEGPYLAEMGHLSPLQLWDIGYSDFNNGVPAG